MNHHLSPYNFSIYMVNTFIIDYCKDVTIDVIVSPSMREVSKLWRVLLPHLLTTWKKQHIQGLGGSVMHQWVVVDRILHLCLANSLLMTSWKFQLVQSKGATQEAVT